MIIVSLSDSVLKDFGKFWKQNISSNHSYEDDNINNFFLNDMSPV